MKKWDGNEEEHDPFARYRDDEQHLTNNDLKAPPPYYTCDISSVEMVEVIHVRFIRGLGTIEDGIRYVQQWWTKEGRMIAENDPFSCTYDARSTKPVNLPKETKT